MKRIISFILISPYFVLSAQSVKYPITDIIVERNGIHILNAWSGGMNAPQFSPIELDNDGLKDLFVFDRGGDRVLSFTNDGSHSDTAFNLAPQYEKLFPPMKEWALIRDYNNDNIPDIFTYQAGEISPQGQQIPVGVKVYKGSLVNGHLQFNVVQYCLLYNTPPSRTNVWVNGIGIPGIVDVNRDGDLDILTLNVFASAVDYYENQTTELGLPADSFLYEKASACWGNFYHGSGNNLKVTLGITCKSEETFLQPLNGSRHSGGAFSVFDYGSDNDVDLLFSGANYDYMVLLNNSGDSSYSNIGWVDTYYPTCSSPLQFPFFPNAYLFDGDNDGLNDLLFAPNLSDFALDVNNVTFYKRIAGDTCMYQSTGNDSFLVHTQLDFGTDSKGLFFDHNGDGLMDIIIANNFLYNPVNQAFSRLFLFENTGTTTSPSFREVSADYAGLSRFSIQGANPALGDLDNDGKKDLLIGDKDGKIHFFKNTGGTIASFPSMTTPNYFNIDAGNFAAPYIYDVNNDGLNDLLIGKLNGTISYYRNFGTLINPQFHPDSVNVIFGNVDVSSGSIANGNGHPYITLDSSGNLLLFVGSHKGTVYQYLINTDSIFTGSFALIDSDFMRYDAGMNVTFQIHDINNDGKAEYLLGNSLGGLQLFSETVWDSSTLLSYPKIGLSGFLPVFPNPANEYVTCVENKGWKNTEISIFDIFSRKITTPFFADGNKFTFNTSHLSGGVYILRVFSDGNYYSAKFLVQH